MNRALFRKEIKSNWMLLVIFLGVLTMYAVMIVMMFDPEMGESLKMMAQSMPQIFAAFGMADVGDTLLEFVTGYLYGILLTAFPCVYIIILANRLAAAYVDRGSMAVLLSAPQKRVKIIVTQCIFMVSTLVIMVVYCAGVIIAAGEILFPKALDLPGFLRVNIGLLGLFIFFGGICFMISALCNETKYSLSISTGIVVYSILLQMISQTGEMFENLKYATPLTLFNVDGLMENSWPAWASCAVLYAVGFGCMAFGIYRFCKRDLPL